MLGYDCLQTYLLSVNTKCLYGKMSVKLLLIIRLTIRISRGVTFLKFCYIYQT